jgi:predicted  nucleic acid-binding Zn-ribbon protein
MNPDVLVAMISAASSAAVAITALILNQRGFTTIENRITSIDNRLNRMEDKFDRMQDKYEALRTGVREEIKLLTGKLVEMDNRLGRIEDRIGPR